MFHLNAPLAPQPHGKVARQLLAGSLGVLLTMGSSWALPTGTTVVNGNATVSQRGNTTTINVATRQSILEHDNFNIARNERVNFRFAQSNSVSLNRIVDGNPTQIHGRLTGNGTILLVNPAGIVFGPTASVNVSGLVASTLNITNDSFLSGNMQFTGGNQAGSVVNEGRIIAKNGATLIGKQISNSGTILARRGAAQLVVGNTVTLATDDGLLTEVTIDDGIAKKIRALRHAILNTGTIHGNTVKLHAELSKQLYSKVINNTGRIQANTVADVNGTVELIASHGNIQNSGKVLSNHTIAIDSGKHILNQGQIGQSGSKSVVLTAKKHIKGAGTLYGRNVTLDSKQGNIKANTNVRNLTLLASNGSATINEANHLTLTSADVKNNVNVATQRGNLIIAGDVNAGKTAKLTTRNGHIINKAAVSGRNVTVNASRNVVNQGDVSTTTGNIKVTANAVRNNGTMAAGKNTVIKAQNGINGNGTIGADGHIKLSTKNRHIGRRNQPLQLLEGDVLKSAKANNGKVYLNRVARPAAPELPAINTATRRDSTTGSTAPQNGTTQTGALTRVGNANVPTNANATQAKVINQRPSVKPNLDYRMVETSNTTSTNDDPILLLQLASDDDELEKNDLSSK